MVTSRKQSHSFSQVQFIAFLQYQSEDDYLTPCLVYLHEYK